MKKKGIAKILKGKGGFSLIELLVVVTIMGILAAVAIPRFMGVLEQAKDRADDSNVHTLKTAAQVFYFETGGWPAEGALNDTHQGNFRDYLDSFPSDPWKRPDTFYVMGKDGQVNSIKPGSEDPENGNGSGG